MSERSPHLLMFARQQLGYIIEEAEATRGALPLSTAIELLIEDRIERRILGPTEAAAVRELASWPPPTIGGDR